MIRTVDISKWGTPYAYNIFDWNQIARPSPNWSGLAGGVLKGSSLGVLGQNDNNVEELETVHVFGTCDFVEGDLVTQLQAQLGVPDIRTHPVHRLIGQHRKSLGFESLTG